MDARIYYAWKPIVMPIAGMACAALCIWLLVRIVNQRERRPMLIAALLALVFAGWAGPRLFEYYVVWGGTDLEIPFH